MDAEFYDQLMQKRQQDAKHQRTPNDRKPTNDIPLTDDKECVTGANAEGLSDQTHGNDPFLAVPAELKERWQWVVWRNENRDGKETKIPYQAIQGFHKAQSNNPETWRGYQIACEHRDRFTGIGFVFSAGDLYCGIDLDNCLSGGSLKEWAKPIADRLSKVAYGEVSPSGNGIKFFTRATLPAGTKHKGYIDGSDKEAIEIYDRARYFTVTGRGKGVIGEGQASVDWLVSEYLQPDTPSETPAPRSVTPSNLNADEVVSQIRGSKQSHKFRQLMDGDVREYGSNSEADLSLCSVISFWTQDRAVIDSIFRRSKLMRPKWDEKHRADGSTYGDMTIDKALEGERETYTPKQYRNINRNSGGYRNVKATWK